MSFLWKKFVQKHNIVVVVILAGLFGVVFAFKSETVEAMVDNTQQDTTIIATTPKNSLPLAKSIDGKIYVLKGTAIDPTSLKSAKTQPTPVIEVYDSEAEAIAATTNGTRVVATLYEHGNGDVRKGRSLNLTAPNCGSSNSGYAWNGLGWFNDLTSSMDTICRTTGFYEHTNRTGKAWWFGAACYLYIGNEANDKTSSVLIYGG